MTRKKHDKPSIDGLKVVCEGLQKQYPGKYKHASIKIPYESKAEAKAGAKRFDASHNQKPYLCRWCCYWHLGKDTNVSIKEHEFVLPIKGEILMNEFVLPDSPLALEVYRLDLEDFFPENHDQFKSLSGYTRNYKNLYSLYDMKIFRVQSYARAVAWAIHVIPKQPVFLKNGNFFSFHKYAGHYWLEKPEF